MYCTIADGIVNIPTTWLTPVLEPKRSFPIKTEVKWGLGIYIYIYCSYNMIQWINGLFGISFEPMATASERFSWRNGTISGVHEGRPGPITRVRSDLDDLVSSGAHPLKVQFQWHSMTSFFQNLFRPSHAGRWPHILKSHSSRCFQTMSTTLKKLGVHSSGNPHLSRSQGTTGSW